MLRKAQYSDLYVNDLKDASKFLDCTMFNDDTIFFYSHKNIEGLFHTVNSELEKKGLKPSNYQST